MHQKEIGTVIKERRKHLPINTCRRFPDLFTNSCQTLFDGNFEEFGHRIGLAQRLVKRELDNFAAEQPIAKELINRSFLSDKLKKYYWQSYNYRRITLH